MKAKDTVMKARDLCDKVCRDYRSHNLGAKHCDGLDCEECTLEAQAEISLKAGRKDVVEWFSGTDALIMFSPKRREEWQAKLKDWGIKKEEKS